MFQQETKEARESYLRWTTSRATTRTPVLSCGLESSTATGKSQSIRSENLSLNFWSDAGENLHALDHGGSVVAKPVFD